jgi:hypothetical protein
MSMPIHFFQPMGGGDRRAAPAEGIEHDVASVRAGRDDALQQGFWLLGLVPETFGGLGIHRRNVFPEIADDRAGHLVKKSLQANATALVPRVVQQPLRIELLHPLPGNRPAIRVRFVALVVVREIRPRVRAAKVARGEPSPLLVDRAVVRFHVRVRVPNVLPMEHRVVRLRVEQQRVGLVAEPPSRIAVAA